MGKPSWSRPLSISPWNLLENTVKQRELGIVRRRLRGPFETADSRRRDVVSGDCRVDRFA